MLQRSVCLGDWLGHDELSKRMALGDNLVVFLNGMVGMSGNDGSVYDRAEGVVVVAGKILHGPQSGGCYSTSD